MARTGPRDNRRRRSGRRSQRGNRRRRQRYPGGRRRGRLATITSDPPSQQRGITVSSIYVRADGDQLRKLSQQFADGQLEIPSPPATASPTPPRHSPRRPAAMPAEPSSSRPEHPGRRSCDAGESGIMSRAAHSRTGVDTGDMRRLPMLVPPLATLLYPFYLEGFHASIAQIVASGVSILSWLSAAACLALAFATPLIAILAAMSFSEISRPTVAQLHAKRTALLAVAAPTLFTFLGVFSPCCTIRCLTPGFGSYAGR